MADIEIACHTSAWGDEAFINALSDIERAGFKGIETTTGVVELFEDRVDVFNEILSQHKLRLVAITAGCPGILPYMDVSNSLSISGRRCSHQS